LKKGDHIEMKGKVYEILSANHQKVAMRGGFMIVEGKCVKDGTKLGEKFRADQEITEVDIFVNRYTYVGTSEDSDEEWNFSSPEKDITFTVKEIEKLCPNLKDYLDYLEDEVFRIREMGDEVIGLEPPSSVRLKIKSTAAYVKGASQQARDKPAVLENGRTVKVPPYCETGDEITVRLPDETFVTRHV